MALFKTIEKLEDTIPVLESSAFGTMLGPLTVAEDQWLRRGILGPTLYDNLHAAYQAQEEAISDATLRALLPFARRVSAHMAMEMIIPLINVQVGSGGLTVSSTPNMAPASKWRVDDLKRQHRLLGFNALDRLTAHCMETLQGYPAWGGSDAFKAAKGFIPTLDLLEQVVNTNRSAWLFFQLRPTLLEVEKTLIKNTIGDEALFLYIEETQNLGGTFSATDGPVITAARRVIVHEAFSRLAVNLSLCVNDLGVTTYSSTMNGDGTGGPEAAGDSRVASFKQYHEGRSQEYQRALIEALRYAADNNATYLAWKSNPSYPTTNVDGYKPDTDISTYGGF